MALRLPRLSVDAATVRLGLQVDGAIEVPSEGRQVGWYAGGPAPGARGPAVFVGHVTWGGRRAAFFRLGDVRRGDRVEVRRADGRVAVFEVTGVAAYRKDRFPAEEVYAPTDDAELRLITCGGRYNRTGYPDNIVVSARLVPGRSS